LYRDSGCIVTDPPPPPPLSPSPANSHLLLAASAAVHIAEQVGHLLVSLKQALAEQTGSEGSGGGRGEEQKIRTATIRTIMMLLRTENSGMRFSSTLPASTTSRTRSDISIAISACAVERIESRTESLLLLVSQYLSQYQSHSLPLPCTPFPSPPTTHSSMHIPAPESLG
jgi:hypothetical protein